MHYVFLLITFATSVDASRLKGKLVPGSHLLDQVLSRFLNKSDYTDTIFEYLRGDENARRRSVDLDVGVLDRENVIKIINNIKTRYGTTSYRRKNEAYYNYPDTRAIKVTALDMMKQSIYATKYRLNETRRFRKVYADNPSFHIAMYYGALMQISDKLETLYTIISKLDRWTHFLWFLVIYEKILAANVDAHDMADRIFDLQEKYEKRLAGEQVELAPTIKTTPGPTKRSRRRRTRTRPPTKEMSSLSTTRKKKPKDKNDTLTNSGEDASNATASALNGKVQKNEATTPGKSDDDKDNPRPGQDSEENKKKGPSTVSNNENDKERRPDEIGSKDEEKERKPHRMRSGLINVQRYF